ncbi:hypothetical protein [Emticicia sp. C21]|uniref:hypothetical protein n=1 Tax=Emticicia sp. C21 TaxID=2302915 RepID=UPI000E34D5AF|nr:hypothetical protein [Emticicia sp. C21]RFS16901.1 hypothetical protein D0T08_09495 [Emticicia sp. C21]
MNSKVILLTLICFLVACGHSKTEKNHIYKDANQVKTEDFNTFLKRFSAEKDFQLSRIKYPLISKYYDYDTDKFTTIITQKEEREFGSLNKKNYIKKVTKEHPEKYILNILLDDTGIYVDYIFELINGKWFLTTTIDQST